MSAQNRASSKVRTSREVYRSVNYCAIRHNFQWRPGSHEPFGWVQDRFGVSWQIVPKRLGELFSDPDAARAGRAMQAMLKMRKLDIATLECAADG